MFALLSKDSIFFFKILVSFPELIYRVRPWTKCVIFNFGECANYSCLDLKDILRKEDSSYQTFFQLQRKKATTAEGRI